MPTQSKLRIPAICLTLVLLSMTAAGSALAGPTAASSTVAEPSGQGQGQASLTAQQQSMLQSIAQDTWNFYAADVDANTSLPRDNIGFDGAPAQGNYTSPTNIGVYMWGIVAAQDLHLINRIKRPGH